MKETAYNTGGRPLYDDDLETIQGEAFAAATAVYSGLGRDCIVSGCSVAMAGGLATIGAGMVWVGGKLLRFLGASGVTLPASLVANPTAVVLDDRDFEDGVNRPCIVEYFAMVQAGVATGVPVYATGGLTLQHVLRGAVWSLGDVKAGQVNLNDYDATGIAKPGTSDWGWALADGQVGRINLAGRTIFGLDLAAADYNAVGKTGGAASVALNADQNGPHNHTMASAGAHTHTYDDQSNREDNTVDAGGNTRYIQRQNQTKTTSSAGAHTHTIDSAGLGAEHENRPPFLVLAMKVWVGF